MNLISLHSHASHATVHGSFVQCVLVLLRIWAEAGHPS